MIRRGRVAAGLAALQGRWRRSGAVAAWLAAASSAWAQPVPQVEVQQPRAFGWQLGDIVERRLSIELPSPSMLDERSLPAPGRPGGVFELRAIERSSERVRDGERLHLKMRYQLFVSPREPRTFELPGFTLRFTGAPFEQTARIDAWPMAAGPLAPPDGSSHAGLGELRPDAVAMVPDGSRPARRVWLWGAAVAALLGVLVTLQFGDRWSASRRRPFARAWRDLSRVDLPSGGNAALHAAQRRLHRAFDESAGHALFAAELDSFAGAGTRYAPLRADIERFYARSRATFFGSEPPGADDGRQLLALARALRDAEP